MIRKNLSIADRGSGRQRRGIDFDRPDFHDAPTGFARRFCRWKSDRKSLRGVSLFRRAMFLMESERERGKTSEPGLDSVFQTSEVGCMMMYSPPYRCILLVRLICGRVI